MNRQFTAETPPFKKKQITPSKKYICVIVEIVVVVFNFIFMLRCARVCRRKVFIKARKDLSHITVTDQTARVTGVVVFRFLSLGDLSSL